MNRKIKTSHIIMGVYVLIFIAVIIVLRLSLPVLLLAYLLLTAVLAAVFYANMLAVIGNYSYASGKTEKGLEYLKKAIDKKTTSPTAHLNYAISLVRSGDGAEAMKYLNMAQALNPKIITDKNIRLTKGSCYWVMGDLDKAVEELEALREKYDYVNVHVLTTLGYMYFAKNDMEKAISFTEKAIDDTPDSGSAWDNMGQIRYRLGERDNAKEAFLKAIEYKNDLADSYYHLGLISEEDSDPANAREYFKKASECSITALNTVTREQIEQKLKDLENME